MKLFLKTYWKTLLFFTLMGLFGGFFTGLYLLDSYPPEIVQEIYAQGIDDTLMGIIGAVQYAGYGLFLGAIGIWLAKKIGLWKDETTITKKVHDGCRHRICDRRPVPDSSGHSVFRQIFPGHYGFLYHQANHPLSAGNGHLRRGDRGDHAQTVYDVAGGLCAASAL